MTMTSHRAPLPYILHQSKTSPAYHPALSDESREPSNWNNANNSNASREFSRHQDGYLSDTRQDSTRRARRDSSMRNRPPLNVPKLALNSSGSISRPRYVSNVTTVSPSHHDSSAVIMNPRELQSSHFPNGYISASQEMSHSRQTSNLSRLDETRSSTVHSKLSTNHVSKTPDKTFTSIAEENLDEEARKEKYSKPRLLAFLSNYRQALDRRLLSLFLLFFGALIMTLLSLQLLYHVDGLQSSQSDLLEDDHLVLRSVGLVCMCTTIILNMCCLGVSAMQFVCAIRLLLTMPCGQLRLSGYLTRCERVRVAVTVGYFLSILLFFVVLILYSFMHFELKTAYAATGFIAAGVIFFICAATHNTLVWWKQAKMPYEEVKLHGSHDNLAFLRDGNITRGSSEPTVIKLEDINELSTLV